MQFIPISGDKWPNKAQKLLLRAALLEGEAALASWHQWSKENDFDLIDTASFFIVPQVYLNLKQFRTEVPELDRLKGIYRWTWSQNQMTLAGLTEVLRLLYDNQIPTVVLKGTPLILHYYKDVGARMMKDADLLIDFQHMEKATLLLENAGWRQQRPAPPNHLLDYLEGLHFVHKRWNLIDIHWRPFRIDTPANEERKLHEAICQTSINGVLTNEPSPTDLLLLTCFHARKSDVHSTCRWIVDAMILMQKSQETIDWEKLLAWSHPLGLLLPVRDAFTYLYNEFEAPIPIETLECAWNLSTKPPEHKKYHQMILHGVNPSLRGVIKEHWTRYGDVCYFHQRDPHLLGFLRYFLCHCQREWRSESLRDKLQRFMGRWFRKA